jgi:hypothetical protein
MKTTMMITAALLLNVTVLFAGNSSNVATSASEAPAFSITALAPVTPKEATFEEAVVDFTSLAPVTPKEADFEENTDTLNILIQTLKPVSPAVADFE